MPDNPNPPAEIAPGVPAPAVISNPNALGSQIAGGAAVIGIALSFLTATLTFWNGHDLIGWINYLQSAPGIGGVTAIAGIALFVWRVVFKKLLDKREEAKLVAALPAAMAMTKQEVAAVIAAPTPEHAKAIVHEIDAVAAATREAVEAGIPVDPAPRT